MRSEHGICACLAFGGVGGGDGVDDRLGFFVADFCAAEWISHGLAMRREGEERNERYTYADNNLARSARDFDRCYELFGQTWSRG